MVVVCKKRCKHDSCAKWPSFNVKSSRTPAYCRQHAEGGMVNVRTRRSVSDPRTAGPARGGPDNVVTTACTSPNIDIIDDSVMNVRKRPRLALDGKQPSHAIEYAPFRGGCNRPAGMDPSRGVSPTSSSPVLRSDVNHNFTVTGDNQTRQTRSEVLPPVPDEHQSGEPIKTEIELAVVLQL
ncbi:unnamed protein product [Laminaria digitata]